ncbi:MAG: rhodanese-like domain-containing protein [Bacteroidota bacterium]
MSLLSIFGLGSSLKNVLRKGAVVIDVRTAYEFDQGRVPRSINIPVDRIAVSVPRIKGMNRPVIVCGAYKIHSSAAARILKENGVKNVYDGGNWQNVMKLYNRI